MIRSGEESIGLIRLGDAIVLRLVVALYLLLWCPMLCLAQVEQEDPDKVSNDRPDRPLQVPPASSEVKEAFDDFDRFQRRGAWERALKSLYTIPESQETRFVDGEDGFIISVARKRWEVLAALPPEGLAAYRLFYDSDAKKLLDEATETTELETLERLYSAYFFTSLGDEAADRLGDLYFQLGRFDRAAECWLAILEYRPDSELSPPFISIKAALALARVGRWDEVEPLRQQLTNRYAEEPVTLGGRTESAAELFERLLSDFPRSELAENGASATSVEVANPPRIELSEEIEADWQFRFADSVVAGMSPAESTQWESNLLSGAIPSVAVAGSKLYANYLGYVLALDLTTGKLLWRSSSFHNIELVARQGQMQWIDTNRFGILASDDFVWDLGRDLFDQNQLAPFRLTCRRADSGDVIWRSSDLADYAQLDLVGEPLRVGESIYIASRTQQNPQQQQQKQLVVMAVRASDGKPLWKTEVGTVRDAQQYYYYGMSNTTPQPRLVYRAGAIYVDTHVGVLARLDAESGDMSWCYGYATDPIQSSGRFVIISGRSSSQPVASDGGGPVSTGSTILIKGEQSDRLGALDPDRMVQLWERPIGKSARLLGANDSHIFIGGPELGALDRETRALLWATRLPGGSGQARVLVQPEGLWQMTPRGIFELDPGSGQVRRIFRGDDSGSDGGDLYLTNGLLLSVTNRTISAYPIGAADAPGQVNGAETTTNTGESDE